MERLKQGASLMATLDGLAPTVPRPRFGRGTFLLCLDSLKGHAGGLSDPPELESTGEKRGPECSYVPFSTGR
jgi:hypothetical protein